MRNLLFHFIIGFILFTGLQAHEEARQLNIEEILCSCRKSLESKDGETNFNPDRIWTFNNQLYVLNDSDQWILAGSRPSSVHDLLEFHAKRGECLKGHPGVYTDYRYYDEGMLYCRGLMHDGSLCPYHMIKQFPPNGIPPKQRIAYILK